MDAILLFPSKYLKCADLRGKNVTLTIAKVQIDELQMAGGAKEKKPVIYFERTEKRLVACKTNILSIVELLGRETDNWIGKRITLRPAKDRFGPKIVECIRIAGSPDAIAREPEQADGVDTLSNPEDESQALPDDSTNDEAAQ